MPRKTYNTKADFDEDYDIGMESDIGHPGGRSEVRLSYHRAALFGLAQKRAEFLNTYLMAQGFNTNTNLLIVGAGFGWTAEVLDNTYGWKKIITTDTSSYIQANQDADEENDYDVAIQKVGLSPIDGEGLLIKGRLRNKAGGIGNRRRHSRRVMNEDLLTLESRNRVAGIFGNIQVAITEELITTLDDTEVVNLSFNIREVTDVVSVIHMTTELLPRTIQDSRYNWKTIQQWKILLPDDIFVSLNTWQIL